MKIVMGIVWFFVIQFVLGLVGGCSSVYIQRAMGVSRENTGMPPGVLILIVIFSLVLAVLGTAKGWLPGTKNKDK